MKHTYTTFAGPTLTQRGQVLGFTLIELMVTISILTILITLATPSFSTLRQNDQLTSQINTFVGALEKAQSIARTENTNVTVKATSGNWNSGWTITRQDDVAVPGNTGTLPTNVKLALATVSAATALNELTFVAGANNLTIGTGTVIFTFCDQRGAARARALEISQAGTLQPSQKPGVNRANEALTCS